MSRRHRSGLLAAILAASALALAPTASAVTIPPATPPGANPLERAYEMVTPPYKNNRKFSEATDPSLSQTYLFGEQIPILAVPSPDGDGAFANVPWVIIDPEGGATAGWGTDYVRLHRGQGRWFTESGSSIRPQGPVVSPQVFADVQAFSLDYGVQAWHHSSPLLPSPPAYPALWRASTRVLGDSGGYQSSGWYSWLPPDWAPEPDLISAIESSTGERALIADDGSAMARWGPYRGLLGAGDPSDGQSGTEALYLQIPPGSGARQLVHECTGEVGVDATEVPARVGPGDGTDTIGARECEAGEVTSPNGAGAGSAGIGTVDRALSDDGRRVFFTGFDDEVGSPQLFVRQYDAAGANPRVRWISRPQVPGQRIGLLGPAIFEGASKDGRIVYFRTPSPLSADDPNGTGSAPVSEGTASEASWDLYRYELPADLSADPADGALTRVSGGNGGADDPGVTTINAGNQPTSAARYISDDGQRAYFVTTAPLAGADNSRPLNGTTDPGGTPGNSETRNLYLYDPAKSGAARWKFITRLDIESDKELNVCVTTSSGSGAGLFSLVGSGAISPPAFLGEDNCVRGSSSGDAIAFMATAQLSADDTDTAADLYVYDADADELIRATAPPAGESAYVCDYAGFGRPPEASCNADLGWIASRVPRGTDGYRNYNIAENAAGEMQALYFQSRLAFSEHDTNGFRLDVYGWSLADRSFELISPGHFDRDAFYSGNSADGSSVFFNTAQPIDPREVDSADQDLYVARAGGGFPYLVPDPPLCDVQAGACQGTPSGAPPAPSPNSASAQGANVVPKRKPRRKRCNRRAKRGSAKARRGAKARSSAKKAKGKGCRAKRGAKNKGGRGR